MQGDDDTTFYMDVLDGYLGALRGGALPLFLAPKLGPTAFWQNCRPQAQRKGIFANTCCTDAKAPCPVTPPPRANNSFSTYKIDATSFTAGRAAGAGFLRHPCLEVGKGGPAGASKWDRCCPIARAPAEFDAAGYAYRYDDQAGAVAYHWNEGWPYGGLGYFLSRGLMRAVGRESWAQCAVKIPCFNADQRVSTCVFNHGYSVTRITDKSHNAFSKHHLKNGRLRGRARRPRRAP